MAKNACSVAWDPEPTSTELAAQSEELSPVLEVEALQSGSLRDPPYLKATTQTTEDRPSHPQYPPAGMGTCTLVCMLHTRT